MQILGTEIQPGQGHAAGRALLAELYRQRTGLPLPPIALGKYGKPYFPGSSLHFSITHTKKHAFCVLSDRPVGIDAEETDRPIRLALAGKVLSPAEYQRFQAAADPAAALLRLWVLKEAQAKCTGLGLQGYPDHTDFSPEDPRIRLADGCYVAIIEEESNAV